MTVPPPQPAGWQPPYPGQPAGWPPPTGWPPPVPPPVARRIPDDLPFVVRQSLGKRLLLFGGIVVFLPLLAGCPVGLAASSSGSISGSLGPLVAVVGCVVVFLAAVFGLQLYLIVSGGPVLAVGPAGLWIKTRPTRGQAIWLPWEAIERIYRRRWSLERMVCVKPRDPRVGANLGAFTALDSSMQQLFFGSGFTATVNFADKPEQQIIAALAHFSTGRCPIG